MPGYIIGQVSIFDEGQAYAGDSRPSIRNVSSAVDPAVGSPVVGSDAKEVSIYFERYVVKTLTHLCEERFAVDLLGMVLDKLAVSSGSESIY